MYVVFLEEILPLSSEESPAKACRDISSSCEEKNCGWLTAFPI